ncbi:transcriptional regulatory protein LevR/transcriptional regulator with AAA-type ATPase domain [Enterococcus sp. PF1-24]|uniref:sigma 54-interacting transcriptional regulator n=1 Tax=unclassified Enterococcus TaxID=2608891 RepID=UPI0024735494|nr:MULTISPECIES: sigma-54-dependent transcriptional regulator [unclassified Enterococcus]MDH6364460.1 transcriptional regulatory protein LevR/transcriptional regulator with AAA-type ATPase domain [Enterococcus sp. PFB1-1]MDH6401517.1 transcriptional regulatory protein LevR/transcriptional regulator with AAA-type ATPase domain [Enterococcus sp. PF1-24]
MLSRKEEILHTLESNQQEMTAAELATLLQIDRSNASRYLSELFKENKISKSDGRPVKYRALLEEEEEVHVDDSSEVSFNNLVGEKDSLKVSIQQAKAAILYPPRGLHTIIFGETGTGKSMFAECMYSFAVESQTLPKDAPFISFNCADYAQNPQLLFGHIFGVRKGAYTGATEDSPGLIANADGGILFLDEIHRLPPEGQEMLFTFIDKGIYRPLGESKETYEASVQIIGATTESSESFLTTFNRRIPMAITLPNLASRSLDERYEIVSLFIKQEANRLIQRIRVEREAVLAFMLYEAEGNIGQVKRDLKLVCAKSFLHYRTHAESELLIRKEDLPLQVQKGLLKIKEIPDRMERFLESKSQYLTFEPGTAEVVWSHDPERNMQVYNDIEEKVSQLSEVELNNINLEELISRDVDEYFQTYVQELTKNQIHKELIPENILNLTDQLYDIAEERLERKYNEKSRFAFALHLQSTIDRIKDGHMIIHPGLNNIRKTLNKEFKVALDLSGIIEEQEDIEIPFDEIGFISMFLSINLGETEQNHENPVGVIILMHGNSTASSMLETAQELLGTTLGKAFNMPLVMKVQTMYSQLLTYVKQNQELLSNGLLLLTDMGSLNSFGDLIYEETGVRTKAISMTSTMIVLEALRMASVGRSLEDIYQNIQMAFESIIRDRSRNNSHTPQINKKAIIVTCFTGEGVASRLYQRIEPVIDKSQVELIQMQFLEKETFKKHIDRLLEEYEIKAIAGTVAIEYQNIPFFSAYDIFDDEKLNILKRVAADEVPTEKIIRSLSHELDNIADIPKFIHAIQNTLQQVQTEIHVTIEPEVHAGMIIHTAFLINNLLAGEEGRAFPNLAEFVKQNRLDMDILRTNFMTLEKNYQIKIPEAEFAFLVEMMQQNRLDNQIENAKNRHF